VLRHAKGLHANKFFVFFGEYYFKTSSVKLQDNTVQRVLQQTSSLLPEINTLFWNKLNSPPIDPEIVL